MLLVQGLAFALALAGFLAATAVENRFQNYLRPSWEPPPVKPVAVPLAAE
jgi:tryptophan-rich sensory protein